MTNILSQDGNKKCKPLAEAVWGVEKQLHKHSCSEISHDSPLATCWEHIPEQHIKRLFADLWCLWFKEENAFRALKTTFISPSWYLTCWQIVSIFGCGMWGDLWWKPVRWETKMFFFPSLVCHDDNWSYCGSTISKLWSLSLSLKLKVQHGLIL